ncbi:sigma-54-dependent transcriptional regulator [Pararhodobacter aggregans]|uniref:Sigma-54-dependent Fis family transcriptional regulator n=1 Tax=Pararhodobacter aggregans TaxID=404875 RepID=A0A2T7UN39_9RHOB|nr:sigma-54 dependent transcriptional regulator [Pararhodobacter aggregans]PTX02497.1 two-component system C4-dicarboxylate transport response regulator DctD [Pararhodobacter aggregans]PVE46102.1 sigma-54-dependent Fis family transcriptional regulator [Pararhodobacter aggregans]
MARQVFVVDDDADFLAAMLEMLVKAGFEARGFDTGKALLRGLDPEFEGVVVSDLLMPGMSGLDLLAELRKSAPDVPVVLITGHGDIPAAVAATRGGAFDFLEKPAPPELLRATVKRALDARALVLENRRLRARIARGTDIRARILGRSEPVKALRREVVAVADTAIDVLLVGEAGTERESIARVIHDVAGTRGDFVTISGPALTEANFDDTMRGGGDRAGVMALAANGTLFIDRLAAIGEPMLSRLLTLLTTRPTEGRCRIIASATPDEAADQLREIVLRLNLAEIAVPPLRERGDDFYFLFEHFVRDAVARHNRPFPVVPAAELRQLRAHGWPGNLRELKSVVERLVIGLSVSLKDRPQPPDEAQDYDSAMRLFETDLLLAALRRAGGRKAEAAESLGIPRKRLYLRMRACGLS